MEQTERLGKYRVDEEIHQSTICSVYRATEESLQRPVLIKKLHPQMAREEDIRDRFEREARVCALVNHENIVSIYGYHADPDLSMLVLEFIDGKSLGALIKEIGAIPWQQAVNMMVQVLQGLAFAHNKGVIHRDLKPDNILISKEGKVKITDFGLATLENAPKLTRQGMVLGTPAYLPPEILTGGDFDQRSDIFSFGVTFYETLTGVSPFQGENFSEIMNKTLKATPKSPSSLIPDIPKELDHLVMRSIEKKPTQRFASADQALDETRRLAQRLEAPLDAIPIKKLLQEPGTAVNSADKIPTETGKSTAGVIKPGISRQKRNATVGLALIAFIIVTAVAVYNFTNLLQPDSDKNLTQKDTSNFLNSEDTSQAAIQKIADNLQTADRATTDANSNFRETDTTDSERNSAEITELNDSDQAARSLAAADTVNMSSSGEGEPAVEEKQTAAIRITTKQWADVFINDRSYGQTPLPDPIELKPGEHRLMFNNNEFPAPVFLTINLKHEENKSLDIDLTDYFAKIRILSVKPWAEIIIDGDSYGLTPRARPVFLPFGEHIIELRNPNYQTWRKEFTTSAENSSIEIVAELEPNEKVENDKNRF